MMKAAIMGFGTIGSGVAEVLRENSELIEKKAGRPIELKYILDIREFPDSPFADKVIHEFDKIERDEEIAIVVEAMGGTKPAYEFVKRCLLAGKHVVTSNKALVAEHGTELLKIAAEKGVNFFFEASVGGGIPIIRTLAGSLAGEKIKEISGILNGTTNYILTKMSEEGRSFSEALKTAQELGYAEQNPEADVEGHDTCRKIAILTAVASGKEVDYKDVPTEGITGISDMDFLYASKRGASIKLLGFSRFQDGKVFAEVAPALVDAKNPLYSVTDVFNGIMVTGNMLGKSMYYGSGAGKLPTASAVVGDMIAAARGKNEYTWTGWGCERLQIHPADALKRRYFARFSGTAEGKRAAVAEAFGEVEWMCLDGADEFALLTKEMTGAEFARAAEAVGDLRQRIVADL